MLLAIVGIAVVALLVGLLIGVAIGKNSPSGESQKARKELEDYKSAVSKHFGKTADLVDNLSNSYRDVFEHLGASARELLSEEDVKRHLQSRANKAVTLTYLADKANGDINKVLETDAIEAKTVSESVNKEKVEADKSEKDESSSSSESKEKTNDKTQPKGQMDKKNGK